MNGTSDRRLTRRTVSRAGLAALATMASGATWERLAFAQSATPSGTPIADWESFDRDLERAMQVFDVVGAAISVVTSDDIV